MDADVSHLQKFADVPYVIEAPASKGSLLGAAAAAVSKRVQVRFDDSRGVAPERYRAMVESIRADLKAGLSPKAGYGIGIYDASTRDPSAEMGRIHASMKVAGKFVSDLSASKGAFAAPFRTPDGIRCVVVGFRPDAPVPGILAMGTGRDDVKRQGLDDETFHRMTIIHESGHCLLGSSEAKADAFMALMVLRDPSFPKGALAAWANWREREEWTLAMPEDDHFTAKSVWAVLQRADALRADPAFRAMSVEEVAGVANAIVEEVGMGPAEQAEVSSVRRAIHEGVLSVAPKAGLREGAAPLGRWFVQNRDVPEFARIVDLHVEAQAGPKAVAPYEVRAGAFREAIGKLAASGDKVAAAMVRGYDTKPDANSDAAKEVASLHSADEGLVPYKFPRTAYQAKVVTAMGPSVPALRASLAVDEPEEEVVAAPGMR